MEEIDLTQSLNISKVLSKKRLQKTLNLKNEDDLDEDDFNLDGLSDLVDMLNEDKFEEIPP